MKVRPTSKNPKTEEKQSKIVSTPELTIRPHRRWRAVFIVVATLFLVGAGSMAAYAFYVSDKILPHTQIAGVEVGGLTKAQAKEKIEAKEKSFGDSKLLVTYQEKHWDLTAKELAPTFQNETALEAAYTVGKNGDASRQVKDFVASLVRYRYFEVDLAPLSDASRAALATKVLNSIETQPSETSLSLVPGKVEIVPGKPGQKLQADDFQGKLYHTFKSGDRTIALTLAPFAPELTGDEVVPARNQASAILSDAWKLQAGDKMLTLSASDMAGLLNASIARDSGGQATGLTLSLKTDELKKKLDEFAKQVNVKPTNAQLKADSTGLAVTVPDKPGLALQVDTTMKKLETAIFAAGTERIVAADVVTAQADLRADTLTQLGLTQLIGTGTTNFSGSPSNRIKNITRGTELLNGELVKDGETFSTIAELSPIEKSNGYVEGLVIINNQTIPADGGGLCQVSTTLFRAVLNAGLPVVSRQSHSYQVSYYQRGIGPGLDATIYDPNPDFKWKNDTGHAIYVQTFIKGTNLTFELYGTSDGRTAAIDGPHTLQTFEPSGDPIYAQTSSLAKGVTQLIDPPIQGAKTTATYTVMRNGEQINKQTFNSFYNAMPAQYLVGTR